MQDPVVVVWTAESLCGSLRMCRPDRERGRSSRGVGGHIVTWMN